MKNTKMQSPLSLRIKKRFELIMKKKKTVISVFLLGIVLATLISLLLPKIYKTTSKVSFDYKTVNSTYLSKNGSFENEIRLLKSHEFLENSVKILAKKGIPISIKDILENSEIIAIEAGTDIDFMIENNDPNNVAEILNTITVSFKNKTSLKNRSSLLSILKAVDEREKLLQQDIKRGMANQQASTISSLSFEHDRIINQVSEFESELENIELQNNFYSWQLASLQKILEEKYPEFSANIQSFNYVKLTEVKLKLERLDAKKQLSLVSEKLGNFEITYPWEEKYDLNELPTTKSRAKRYLDSYLENLFKNNSIENNGFVNELSKAIFDNQVKVNAIDITKSTIFSTLTFLEDQFNQIPFSIIEEARKSRIKKFNTKLIIKINSLNQSFMEKEGEFFAEVESVRQAKVPKSYFSPNIILNIFLGALIGFLVGVIIAAGSSDTSKIELVTNAHDLEEAGYKLISQIPNFPGGSPLLYDSSNKENNKMDEQILSSFESIEKFIKYGDLEKAIKTVLVTSGEDGEGKSILASNIAIAIANAGNKVLLVDADLLHPQLNKYFKVKATPSLAHYLFRKKELDEIVRKTHNENLDLITCIEFPQNPSVIITSERMKNFMTQVEERYDYIVYDSCSLSELKETAALAKSIDQVILTVRANKTKLSEIFTAQMVLEKYGVTDFNVVLNDIKA